MGREEHYPRYASDALQLARRAQTTDERDRLLQMAEAWFELAERAARATRNLRPPKEVHPLVRDKLDPQLKE
jgi:hypothetical protein